MKISEAWLREWVNPAISTEQLITKLTMAGLEVDSCEPVAGKFSGVIVAQVLSAEKHPDADRLRVCKVSTGTGEPLNIVCGAQNVRANLKVALATIGAILPGDFAIKKSKLRGVESEGMLCSVKELGLATESDGIMELPEDAPVGKDLRDYLQLNDHIIEIELTANRGDCLSVQGIAREVAALTDSPFKALTCSQPKVTITDTLPVTISAEADCPRYLGRIIKNINNKIQTPLWMQEKLRRSGIRSISPIVDVTNFVMIELGQPLHAFDFQKLHGGIHVRKATANESLTLLDEQTVKLNTETLVIADQEKPIALAGIFGGKESGVSATTTTIFLESAYFPKEFIAGRARSYGLHTDGAHRWERGVDPELQLLAMERATQLIVELVGGEVGPLCEKITQQIPAKRAAIFLRRPRIEKILGISITDEQVIKILTALGMKVVNSENGWSVTPPSYRFDLAIEVDLIEELARVYGYENIPVELPTAKLRMFQPTQIQNATQRLRNVLVDRGYQEAITYSFVSPEMQQKFDPNQPALILSNPIAADMAAMRTNLWPGLMQALLHNQRRQQARVRLFEIGMRYLPQGVHADEDLRVAGIASHLAYPEQWGSEQRALDFFDVKADIVSLIRASGLQQQCEFVAASLPALHPGQTAAILINKEVIGHVGALHPSLVQEFELSFPVYLFELRVQPLAVAVQHQGKGVSKFPAIRRDIAILIDDAVRASDIQTAVVASAGEILQDLIFFDVYKGKGIPEGRKSLAVGLTLQHPSRTLVEDEVNQIMQNIISSLQTQLNAVLRE